MSTVHTPPVSTDREVIGTTAEVSRQEAIPHAPGGRLLAVARICLGFVFLWAFVDKVFALGYSTTGDGAWIRGGSPTAGFLGHLEAGPLRGMFGSWAGVAVIDWLFMLALLGVGITMILGVGLRVSAIAGSLLMLGMWLAEWPFARFGADGAPTGSTNPLVDYHVIFALVLAICAVSYAGRTWGLGKRWERQPIVARHRWLV